MSSLLKDIESRALELPASERELLASHLFQSVHDQRLSELDSEWLKVAEERYAALQNGVDQGISEKEFFQRLG